MEKFSGQKGVVGKALEEAIRICSKNYVDYHLGLAYSRWRAAMTKVQARRSRRILFGVANFAIGLFFFVVGGWLGQWGFTWNLRIVFSDIYHSGRIRAIPFYSMGNYGLVWNSAYFVNCPISAFGCVGDVPAQYVITQDIGFLVLSAFEVAWFCYLVWRSFKVQ